MPCRMAVISIMSYQNATNEAKFVEVVFEGEKICKVGVFGDNNGVKEDLIVEV